MDFKEYQEKSATTALYPKFNTNHDDISNDKKNFLAMSGIIYTALGLSNEAGEVLGKIKKLIRDNNCQIDVTKKEEISKELGDVLWYVSNLASELNIELDYVAQENLNKLFSRKERGTIKGSGDER